MVNGLSRKRKRRGADGTAAASNHFIRSATPTPPPAPSDHFDAPCDTTAAKPNGPRTDHNPPTYLRHGPCCLPVCCARAAPLLPNLR